MLALTVKIFCVHFHYQSMNDARVSLCQPWPHPGQEGGRQDCRKNSSQIPCPPHLRPEVYGGEPVRPSLERTGEAGQLWTSSVRERVPTEGPLLNSRNLNQHLRTWRAPGGSGVIGSGGDRRCWSEGFLLRVCTHMDHVSLTT